MTDIDDLRDHVESLSDSDLHGYLRLAMQNGENTRAAVADQEIQRRRES